jgi:hypothetical protein
MGKSALFLGVTLLLLFTLGVISFRLYRRGRQDEVERPKHRMLEDD